MLAPKISSQSLVAVSKFSDFCLSILDAFQRDLSQLRRYLSMFTGVVSQKQVRLKVKLHLSCQVL